MVVAGAIGGGERSVWDSGDSHVVEGRTIHSREKGSGASNVTGWVDKRGGHAAALPRMECMFTNVRAQEHPKPGERKVGIDAGQPVCVVCTVTEAGQLATC